MKELTKQELIKVFSAYLPYCLKVAIIGETIIEDDPTPKEFELVGVNTDYIEYHEIGRTVNEESYFEDVFPILWDLSMLTKEIAHEGERFIPLNFISIKAKQLLTNPEHVYPNVKNGIEYLPHNDFDRLLKYHFNVFNLDESQYINKATLKTD